jgi:putative PIN family toxin of toxin-antitoxin system
MLSGYLWRGGPSKCLTSAGMGDITLCGTEETYQEFCRVISYNKFANRLKALRISPQRLSFDYRKIVNLYPIPEKQNQIIIEEDPDDDIFIYAAIASSARIIVSGDRHLIELEEYNGIHILTSAELVDLIAISKIETPKPVRFPRHPRLAYHKRF